MSQWDGARGCLIQAIDDASDTEVVRGLREILDEWIDPQRIVELGQRFTDEGKPGWVEVVFVDWDPQYGDQWEIRVRGNTVFAKTANEALKAAEA